MANTIRDYSATAAANTTVDGADISEGCSPAGINDAIRGVMADLKDVSTGAVALESPAFDSASLTGDLTFGDNDKAIFGAGSDLQIYHNSANNRSYITESGAGAFVIQGENLILEETGGNNYIQATAGGAVQVYHNGSEKLATTATGVDVTGTVTADNVGIGTVSPQSTRILHTVSSNANQIRVEGTGTESGIEFKDSGSTNFPKIGSDGDDLFFDTAYTPRMTITSGGSVGIATGSPTKKVSASIGLNDTDGYVLEYSGDAKAGILLNPIGGEVRMGAINSSGTYFTTLYSNNSEAVRIDSSGRVTMPYQPAFFASGGGGSFNSSGIFVGDSSAVQKTNVGNHYSYSTGRFTAPVAGVYMFSYLLTTNDTASHMVNIHINGADNLQPVLNYYNEYDSATNVVIFTLAANDYVEAHLRASSGYGYYGARFCGHLIG